MKSTIVPLVETVAIANRVQRMRASEDVVFFFDTNPEGVLSFPLQTHENGNYCKYQITLNSENFQIGAREVLASGIWHIISEEFLFPDWERWGIEANNKAAIGAAIDRASSSVVVPVEIGVDGNIIEASINDERNRIGVTWDSETKKMNGGIGTIRSVGNFDYMVTDVISEFAINNTMLKRVGSIVNETITSSFAPAAIGLGGEKSVYDNLPGKWVGGAFAYDETPHKLADIQIWRAVTVGTDQFGEYSILRGVEAALIWQPETGSVNHEIDAGTYGGQLLDGQEITGFRRYWHFEVFGRIISIDVWDIPNILDIGICGFLPFVAGMLLKKSNLKMNVNASIVPGLMALLRILEKGEGWQQTE